MARLHEYQGKALLAKHGIQSPRGNVARTAKEAHEAAVRLDNKVVLKVQAWVTGRKAKGGVVFASSPEEAEAAAAKLLSMKFGNFPVEEVLIEEQIEIAHELFISMSIDDGAQAPVLLFNAAGGSGIEDRAASVARLPVDVENGVDAALLESELRKSPVPPAQHKDIVKAVQKLVEVARDVEARSLEINPLVVTNQGKVLAADCRIMIDDYAVFRHPELGIEIARELDHPATKLERIAYEVEQSDHRGTFYFAQLPTDGAEAMRGVIGFHGAGGGGSMMSMDAVTNAGFTLANFCDTSGNPSAAKVYRAARIILAQPDIVGYFGSGSGVASQEQFWSAYGLAKAFLEMNMSLPVVARLGGNSEDRAVEILESACASLPARVEGYRKDDTPAFCAERFAELVSQSTGTPAQMSRRLPGFVGGQSAMSFPITGGCVWIDTGACDDATKRLIITHSSGLLQLDEKGNLELAVDNERIAGKDSELIALEIEMHRAGKPVVFIDLPVPGLDDRANAAAA